jgi:hypothetical protein
VKINHWILKKKKKKKKQWPIFTHSSVLDNAKIFWPGMQGQRVLLTQEQSNGLAAAS